MRAVLILAALGLAACAPETEMPGPSEGAAIFAANCAACHGADAGGGEMRIAGKRPPDLTRIAARNDGAFPRARVLSTIDGYRLGTHDRAMPEFGAILGGDTVPVPIGDRLTPTPRPLAALLAYLEEVQAP
jgi:mono/diheme cytochrome c family protein